MESRVAGQRHRFIDPEPSRRFATVLPEMGLDAWNRRALKMAATTPKLCSCAMCGNLRRAEGPPPHEARALTVEQALEAEAA